MLRICRIRKAIGFIIGTLVAKGTGTEKPENQGGLTAWGPVPKTATSGNAGNRFGAVAQLGERLVRNEEASGSIPLSSTIPLRMVRRTEDLLARIRHPPDHIADVIGDQ